MKSPNSQKAAQVVAGRRSSENPPARLLLPGGVSGLGQRHSIVIETLFDGVAEQALCTIAVHVPEASSPPSEALI
jgi:hypothetical protein